jgi:type I restriction enzyme, S subunit
MPSKLIPLSQIADITGGFAFKSDDFGATGFPVVKIAQIEPPRVNLANCERISPDKVRTLDRFRLKHRDILMAMTGATIGKVGRFRFNGPAYLNQRVAKISAKAGPEFDNFIYAIVSQANFDTNVINNAAGSAQANVSAEGIGQILVPDFQRNEQLEIGRIIGALDDKIELNRQVNETLEALTRTLFQQTISNGTATDVGKFEQLADLCRDAINPREFPDETFDHYSIPAFDEERLPKPETGELIKSNKFRLPSNAVMISKLNPRIPRVWMPRLSSSVRSIASTEFLVAVPKPDISREWLYGLLTSQPFLDVFTTLVTGTSGSHQRVKPEYLLAMDVEIPRSEAIQHHTRVTAPLHKRIALNLEESRTLAALRDALLPKLLSGEVRPVTTG